MDLMDSKRERKVDGEEGSTSLQKMQVSRRPSAHLVVVVMFVTHTSRRLLALSPGTFL